MHRILAVVGTGGTSTTVGPFDRVAAHRSEVAGRVRIEVGDRGQRTEHVTFGRRHRGHARIVERNESHGDV